MNASAVTTATRKAVGLLQLLLLLVLLRYQLLLVLVVVLVALLLYLIMIAKLQRLSVLLTRSRLRLAARMASRWAR